MRPMAETIREGCDVFLHDGDKAVGAVRRVHARALIVYVENAGDFEVPLSAVKDAHDEKVVLDSGRIDPKMKAAIAGEHRGEDPRI
jgi:hypothetical protein